ncbi:hypothetical protein C8J56DRAFT_1004496 [Mycena floridula]|nr:hypothetical protein C8J56DRAFT_1004496 [Mycena floridula]
MAAADIIQCPACNKTVKQRGLLNHLHQSRNARCYQFFRDQETSPETGEGSDSGDSKSSGGFEDEEDLDLWPIFGPASAYSSDGKGLDHKDAIIVDSEGDLFGNYDANSEMEVNSDEGEGEGLDDMEMTEEDVIWLEGDPDEEQVIADVPDEVQDIKDLVQAQLEQGIEPQRDKAARREAPEDDTVADTDPQAREHVEDKLGSANQGYAQSLGALSDKENIYAPFSSQMDWEIARWAKLRGPSSTAFTELMSIPGIVQALNLSFKSSADIDKAIDDKIPAKWPRFHHSQVIVANEVFDVYFRDIIRCIRALFGDQEFTPYLVLAPERHYVDEKKTVRMFHDMHTGHWWWSTQEELEAEKPGATIIPIILSSDKTQVTLFHNKSVYPLYMTIGNIPKEIRRKPSCGAYVLLTYLPTSRLKHITSKAARRQALSNLYHACVSKIMAPLKAQGKKRITMTSGDGTEFDTQPLFAVFIGDYLEQVLVGGPCLNSLFRDLDSILDALESFDTDPAGFYRACGEAGVKPIIDPFWKDLPYAHIYQVITPDVLHQLYQGVIKHLLAWLIKIYTEEEIDAQCRRLPPNHNIRLFMNGVSKLSRVSGTEHDQISILGFLYLAQYPVHTTETLESLNQALQRFHDNKQVFIDLGICDDFTIPKLHFMVHYVCSIMLFGTTDNFNMEYTGHAYHATNRKDEYSQMTLWLERREKVNHHEKYIQWHLDGCLYPKKRDWVPPSLDLDRRLQLTKLRSGIVTVDRVMIDYGAQLFYAALARFVTLFNEPDISQNNLDTTILQLHISFVKVPVWHIIKYLHEDPVTGVISTADSVHVQPSRQDKRSKLIPGRFDTALINDGHGGETGITGYRIGQVRVMFSIPKKALPVLFHPGTRPPQHLAYIEWFSPFPERPGAHHLLYKVSRSRAAGGGHLSSIVPVANIHRSAHLLPKFGPVAPVEWTSSSPAAATLTSSNVLDLCPTFYVNPFVD